LCKDVIRNSELNRLICNDLIYDGDNLELNSVRLINFRCFKDSGEIPIHSMTIFIGENDCGKSSIIKAIDFFLQKDNKPLPPDMFNRINENYQLTCSIELCFILDEKDLKQVKKEYILDKVIDNTQRRTLSVKKDYIRTGLESAVIVKTCVMGNSFNDTRLNYLDGLIAEDIKELCNIFNLKYTRKDESIASLSKFLSEHLDSIPKSIAWIEVEWKTISEILPRFEYYCKTTMGSPLNLIGGTLAMVYRQFFYAKDAEGNEKLNEGLATRKAEIEKELDNQIEKELMVKIKATNAKVKSVKGDYKIEFSEGFHLANLKMDLGAGPNTIDSVGEGTKARLFLAITEWDREVRAKERSRKVIRGYDEPDTNLHYDAQKEIFNTLEGLSQDADANVQVLICTHSIMMIDRAAPTSIIHIKHKEGVSSPNWLKGTNDNNIKEYLNSLSGLSSIRNSSLFFERCFLVYEGDTEEKVLPIVYKKVTGRSFEQDGIVPNNLRTNSTWDVFLRLLSYNKSEATILFLDKDIQDTKKNINVGRLRSIGFSEGFATNNVVLAGNKELEDAFPDEIICHCLNNKWPRNDGRSWDIGEISVLRKEKKFSDAIMEAVKPVTNNRYTKHDFGEQIALLMTREQILEIPCLNQFVELANKIVK
jgi:putative ATP-dependent endonuclease of the OLD family